MISMSNIFQVVGRIGAVMGGGAAALFLWPVVVIIVPLAVAGWSVARGVRSVGMLLIACGAVLGLAYAPLFVAGCVTTGAPCGEGPGAVLLLLLGPLAIAAGSAAVVLDARRGGRTS